MLLSRGLTSDFDSVCALYARVTSAMHEKGIAQWNWGTYPNADQIHKSIDAGTLYVVREGTPSSPPSPSIRPLNPPTMPSTGSSAASPARSTACASRRKSSGRGWGAA